MNAAGRMPALLDGADDLYRPHREAVGHKDATQSGQGGGVGDFKGFEARGIALGEDDLGFWQAQ